MSQSTSHIFMVRPKHFGFNVETAANNSFQVNDTNISPQQISQLAVEEFDQFVDKLRSQGIDVYVVEDTDEPVKFDAVFPNNWVSTHEDGMVMLYPMYAPIRRQERRQDIIENLKIKYVVSKEYTFEHYEEEGLFIEGTGSLILDRVNKIVYANLSDRTDLQLLEKWSILMRYEKVPFLAKDRHGKDIYHTNVVMSIGSELCIICLEAVPSGREKDNLLAALNKTNKVIVDISLDQLENFAGNMLELCDKTGKKYLVMSSTAYNSLTTDELSVIHEYVDIITGEIPTIEKYGGGSVRCMIAEIFLPLKK
jgi:hypothetical protein